MAVEAPRTILVSPLAGSSLRSEEGAIEAASFILSLRAKGIHDTGILRAMEIVPREIFAPRRFTDLSRTDVALPLPCGQTMTAPGTVAAMLVALGVQKGHQVLEIGTGSGYVTTVLVRLGARVLSLERFTTLAESAREHLKIAEVADGARIEIGDGLNLAGEARFDRIILNGALASVPATVTSLLEAGGRLVGALTIAGLPRLVRIDRTSGGDLQQELAGGLRLSPLVPGIAAAL